MVLQLKYTYFLLLGLTSMVGMVDAIFIQDCRNNLNADEDQVISHYHKPKVMASYEEKITDCQWSSCHRVFINYSNDGTCHPAVNIENQVVISVCEGPMKLAIIGHATILTNKTWRSIYENSLIWIFMADIDSVKHKEISFNNLSICVSYSNTLDLSRVQFFQYNKIEAYNCKIIELFNFWYIKVLRFTNCELNFNNNNQIFMKIGDLAFQNCTFSKLDNLLVTVTFQFCSIVTFNSCVIQNNHDYELSLLIYGIESISFINCSFHTMNGYQENFLVFHLYPTFRMTLMPHVFFDKCTVHGRNKFVLGSSNTRSIPFLSITNCWFTDIVSDNLLSITGFSSSLDINYDETNTNYIIIENSIFKNITSNKNILSLDRSFADDRIIEIMPVIHMFNVSFINNTGTPIYARNLGIDSRSVSFINNTGTHAGAVFIEISIEKPMDGFYHSIHSQQLNVTLSNILLQNNIHKSDNGGDMYIRVVNHDELINLSRIKFFNTSNAVIFFESSTSTLQKWSNASSFRDISTAKYLKTFPRYIDAEHLSGSDIFLGKTIYLSGCISVTDYFNNDASCNAAPSIHYNQSEEDNCTIELASNDKIKLKTGKEVMSNVYVTAISVDCLEIKRKEITLEMACEYVTITLTLILRGCPLGYKPSNHSDQNGQQLLTCEVADEGNFIETDDSEKHIACIDRDYWYGKGNINGSNHPITFKVYCGPPYCVQNTEACPLAGYTNTHQKLPWTQDEQCSGLYGGVLCRSCQEHAVFTFGASKCISLNDCKQWQPYLIICLAIFGQIALSLVMICSRTKTTIGVGYLYGPLFFIAAYKLLPLSNSYLQQISPLEYTFSVYETVLLLDLDVLGKVNWCIFNVDKTLLYSMRFIGPLVTFLVLLVIVLIARSNFCFKFKINRIIQSPIQPMCLLIILSFWSLSKTSIEIIKPVIINGEWRFAIQPEYNYLGNGYIIGLFSISVALLMCFYLPFIFLLFSSQFIRRKINLFRIQPFLDAFQSSYKDKYQWFSGVYLFSWLVLNTELPSYAFVIVITGVSVLQFTLHPHKSELLNITDNLLLADIIIMSSLSYMRNEDHAVMIIKYPLLIIPLIYILLGGVWIPLRIAVLKCRSMILNRCQATSNEPMRELMEPIEDALIDSGDIDIHANGIIPQDIVISNEMEREPLIYDDY